LKNEIEALDMESTKFPLMKSLVNLMVGILKKELERALIFATVLC